jgi:hypothetical protein
METSDSEGEEGFKSGPWVEKGNPAGYLDTEDERELEEEGLEEVERKQDGLSGTEWREAAEFLLFQVGVFMECKD